MPDIMICVLDPQVLVRQYQLPHPQVYQKGSFPILVVQVSRLDRVEDDIDMGRYRARLVEDFQWMRKGELRVGFEKRHSL